MPLTLPEGLSRLCLAVSGGVDSMALSLLAKEYASAHNITLHALHVDHRLREGSSIEAEQTCARLHALGINTTILPWAHEGVATAIQERARDARYALMDAWCHAHNFPALATAHHADDQAETIAFRLWRGAGVEGLAGMRPSRQLEHTTLLRPLLHMRKGELRALATQAKLEWVEDPSNQNPRFDRVKIRTILAAHPELTPALLALGQRMQVAADAIANHIQTWLTQHARLTSAEAHLPIAQLMQEPLEYRWRIIAAIVDRFSTAPEPPRYPQFLRIAEQPCQKTQLAGCGFTYDDVHLYVKPLQS